MTDSAEVSWSARQRAFSVAVIIATSFGVGLAFGIGYPLTALTFEAWQQPKWIIGLAGAAPAFGLLIVLPFAPPLVAKIGPTFGMTLGFAIGALGFLSLHLTDNPWVWIAIRAIMTGGMGIPWLTGETWINSVAPSAWRGRVISLYAIAFFLGFAIGPSLLQEVGTAGPLPFLIAAGACIACCLPVIAGRRITPSVDHDRGTSFIAASRLAPAAIVGGFVGGFTEITTMSLLPNVAIAGGLPSSVGLSMLTAATIGGMVLQIPIGWWGDKLQKRSLLVGMMLCLIVLVSLLPATLSTPVGAGALAFLVGGAIVGLYSLSLGIIGEGVGRMRLAAANAAFLAMYQIGAVLGPLIAGGAMTVSPVYGFSAALAVTLLIGIVAILRLPNDRRPDGNP